MLEDARRSADERLDVAERDAAARLQEAEAVYETQRAKAAKAAADFETTLATRRQKAEAGVHPADGGGPGAPRGAARHIEDSRAEAEAAQAEAARESRRLIDDAEQQAATIVGDAKVVAARIRAESERELAAATQRRDSINAQLGQRPADAGHPHRGRRRARSWTRSSVAPPTRRQPPRARPDVAHRGRGRGGRRGGETTAVPRVPPRHRGDH